MIRMISAFKNLKAGQTVDCEPAQAAWLVSRKYAEEAPAAPVSKVLAQGDESPVNNLIKRGRK